VARETHPRARSFQSHCRRVLNVNQSAMHASLPCSVNIVNVVSVGIGNEVSLDVIKTCEASEVIHGRSVLVAEVRLGP